MHRSLFVLVVATFSFAIHARDAAISAVKPETVGFSSERLQRLDAGMKAIVDSKQLAGIVTMVARHGQVVQQTTYGHQDLANNAPMRPDSIFRIYSMTKPITGVAMMMLYEEGKWRPSDPVSRYIPEFRDLKVFAGLDKDGKPTFEAPKHAPTMAGTWFWIDPTNDVLFIGMIQRWATAPVTPNIEDLSRQLTMQALTDPGK
jgi:CubicO group peptidase (beta-lactamase class C family)